MSIENRKSGRDKDKKHRKRHLEDENDVSLDKNGKEHSRSSHRHSSERKKSRQVCILLTADFHIPSGTSSAGQLLKPEGSVSLTIAINFHFIFVKDGAV